MCCLLLFVLWRIACYLYVVVYVACVFVLLVVRVVACCLLIMCCLLLYMWLSAVVRTVEYCLLFVRVVEL